MSIIKIKTKDEINHSIDTTVTKKESVKYKDIRIIQEDIKHKDERSVVYQLNNKLKKAVVFSETVNYFDEATNKWEEIDNTLVEKDESFINERSHRKLEIFKGNKKGIKLERDELVIEWEYLGNKNRLFNNNY